MKRETLILNVMRTINYILIHETDYQIPVRATSCSHDANLGFHYIIGSEGIVRNPIDIRRKGSISKHIRNLNSFDRRDYDAYSIGIVVQGAKFKVQGEAKPEFQDSSSKFQVKPETGRQALKHETSSSADSKLSTLTSQRKSLTDLLAELRSHFPEAKILSTSEIDGKFIHPSDAMNLLRRELSEQRKPSKLTKRLPLIKCMV